MKLIEMQKRLNDKNIRIFTVMEFRQIMDLSEIAAQKILERYTKKGILIRLKKGLYTVKTRSPGSFFISNKIYMPSYISFETALNYYGIIPETVYEITAATTKATRNFVIEGRAFTYYKIKSAAYTGYKPMRTDDGVVQIAYPEKALVDYLYFVHLRKKILNERLSIDKLNRKKIFQYIRLYNRPNLERWIKNDIIRGN